MKFHQTRFNKIKIYWPYFIFGAFLIVVLVNVVYIFVAEKTWRGIFTENSYEKGINYNKTLEKIREQEKLGVNISTQIKQGDYNYYNIRTHAVDRKGNIINNSSVLYIFRYNADPSLNFALVGQVSQSGSYFRQEFSLPHIGDWEVETALSFQDKVVQDIKFITLKPKINNELQQQIDNE